MKAIRIHQRGGPEVLIYEDAPRPRLMPGDALVHPAPRPEERPVDEAHVAALLGHLERHVRRGHGRRLGQGVRGVERIVVAAHVGPCPADQPLDDGGEQARDADRDEQQDKIAPEHHGKGVDGGMILGVRRLIRSGRR